jgi:hypothetical protein
MSGFHPEFPQAQFREEVMADGLMATSFAEKAGNTFHHKV